MLQERVKDGNFANVEDMLLETLASVPRPEKHPTTGVPIPASSAPPSQAKDLYELFAPIRGLLTNEEIDTMFRRDSSPGRPVDLA